MLSLLPGGRILVAVESVDGRKGIDSLAGVVRSVLQGDPLSGDLLVLRTRPADYVRGRQNQRTCQRAAALRGS